jgi:hypothetical protein
VESVMVFCDTEVTERRGILMASAPMFMFAGQCFQRVP